MKGVMIRQYVRPDPELAIFKQGVAAGVGVVLFLVGILCSLCTVQISLP